MSPELFESANRAHGYTESGPKPAATPPDLGPWAEVPANASQGPPPEQMPTLPANREVAPARPQLDVGSASRDLTGSWFTNPAAGAATIEVPLRATRGMRGALARLGLAVAPGAAERAEAEAAAELARDETIIRQSTWPRAVGVLVANRKGGVSKTPVSLLLGGTLASVRGGSVAVTEVSDDPGMLSLRAEGSPRLGLGDLMQEVGDVHSAGALAGYTSPQTSHAAVLGSPKPRANLRGEDVAAIADAIDRHYAIRVMDSGNVYTSPAFIAAYKRADALVIPVYDAPDAMQDALALVETLYGSDHGKQLVHNATVVRSRSVPAPPAVVQRVDEALGSMGVARVVDVPFDPHIAEHGELSLSRLAPATRAAFVRVAAGVVQSLDAVQPR